jgi:hypothetical protein
MKKTLFLFAILIAVIPFSQAQNRGVTRGAAPGELYIAGPWYGIYSPIWGPPYYDTLRTAVYRMTENGKKLTIQYDADYFTEDIYEMRPEIILADATTGVLYNRQMYLGNDGYVYTQLYASFNYGKNWNLRDENIGGSATINTYYTANIEGLIYKRGVMTSYKSEDYGTNFCSIETGTPSGEPSFLNGEFFSIGTINPYVGRLYHTYNMYETYDIIPIDSQYVYVSPDVYRGGLPGEVYVSSRFPDWTYQVSFSADTGHTFHKVFISESYTPYDLSPSFMSDREPGVFYIIRVYTVIDPNPWGEHFKLCIYYYKDYGETLVDIYCHDITKDYGSTCEEINDLALEKCNPNCILLSWSEPESSLPVEGYHIYRNEQLINEQLTINTTYYDENLPSGEYEYYVVTHYTTGCVSDSSNHAAERVEIEDCKPVTDLTSEKINNNSVLLTWTEPEEDLEIDGYSIYRNNNQITESLVINTSYLDEHLLIGNYEYYVITHYSNECISDSSNHVEETIAVGIKEFDDGIIIYPNPTSGELRVTSYELQVTSVEVFDVYGKKYESTKARKHEGEILLDISELPTGIYFIKITTEKGEIMKKVIKY